MSYEEAWSWLEKRGGGVYSSRLGSGGAWACSVGGGVGMAEVVCSGHGHRHDEARVNAAQELRYLYELLSHPRPESPS